MTQSDELKVISTLLDTLLGEHRNRVFQYSAHTLHYADDYIDHKIEKVVECVRMVTGQKDFTAIKYVREQGLPVIEIEEDEIRVNGTKQIRVDSDSGYDIARISKGKPCIVRAIANDS